MLKNKDGLIWKIYEKNKGIVLYIIFGAITTFINIVTYFICYNLFRIDNVTSTIIAWFFAVIFAFVTNKVWVFDSKSWKLSILKTEFIAFISVRLITGLVDVAIMWVGVDLLKYNSLLMKILSNVIVLVSNYIGSRLFIFKDRTNNKTE